MRSPNGRTALHHAVISQKIGAIQTLLEMGADPTIEDNARRNALEYANQLGNQKVIDLIRPIYDQDIEAQLEPETGAFVTKLKTKYPQK